MVARRRGCGSGATTCCSRTTAPIVWGAAYTDVNARLPLFTFQAGAGIVLAGALIANIWLRRLWLPVAAAGHLGRCCCSSASSIPRRAVLRGHAQRPVVRAALHPARDRRHARCLRAEQRHGEQLHRRPAADGQGRSERPGDRQQPAACGTTPRSRTPTSSSRRSAPTTRFNDIDIDRYTIAGAVQVARDQRPRVRLQQARRRRRRTGSTSTSCTPTATASRRARSTPWSARACPTTWSATFRRPDRCRSRSPRIYFGELTNNYALAPSNTPSSTSRRAAWTCSPTTTGRMASR